MSGRSLRALVVAVPLLAMACGEPNVDLQQALEVTDLSSGYVETGVVAGKTRIAPSVSFRLKRRAGADEFDTVAINVGFRNVQASGDQAVFDDKYLQRVQLGPDGQSQLLVVNADTGFTGDPPQTSADMLQHSQFQDLVANILAKQGSGKWVEVESTKIERRILAR